MNLRLRMVVDYYFGGLLHAVLRIPTILLGKLMGRNHDLSTCSEIAVLKLLGGGSLVIAYPALLALRRLPRVKKLTLITTPAIRPFGEILGVFDEIIVVREESLLHIGMDSVKAISRLFRHDAIIDFEVHSRLTTVFSLLTCARNRVGFFTNISYWRRGISTHLLFCNTSNGIYHFYDQIAAIFGAVPVDEDTSRVTFRQQLQLGSASDTGEFHIGIAPTCSGLSRERMMEPSEWIDILTKRLENHSSTSVNVHLFGGPSDQQYLDRLKELFEDRLRGRIRVTNHAGKTKLVESVKLLAGMNEVLCIDSALLHFSRLLGLRTVSYWGPTDPSVLARPRSGNLDEIHYVKLPCSPCVHVSAQPPCKGRTPCMRLAANPNAPVPANPPWVLQ